MDLSQKQHGIKCEVTSCQHQQNGGCSLESISVQPCTDCITHKKEDQSMCSSYNPQR